MEIRNLYSFLQVASLHNFTKAGRHLGYSQSNISAQIQQLERDIGVQLFNRVGKNITLTQYGEELIPYAKQIVSTVMYLENFVKKNEALGGTLQVGIVESLSSLLLEEAVNNYHKRFPLVKINVTVDAAYTLKENIQQGLLDFICIIDEPLPSPKWQCIFRKEIPIEIIAHAANPLTKKKRLNLSDLQNEEFILMEDSASYSACFQSIMAARQLKLKTFLRLQNANMACRLVETGNYLSVLPLYTVQKALQRATVRILPIKDFAQTKFIQIALPQGKLLTPQIRGFLEEMQKILQRDM